MLVLYSNIFEIIILDPQQIVTYCFPEYTRIYLKKVWIKFAENLRPLKWFPGEVR